MTQADLPDAWPFKTTPACVGMVHLPALPGAPRSRLPLSEIRRRAVDEARLLAEAGFDGVMVENFGDVPFFPEAVDPHTIAAMAVVVAEVCRAVELPVGVNVLRNDARAAVAVAVAANGRFVRVNVHTGAYATDQGVIQGRAAETLRYRKALAAGVAIFADVHVKHATVLGESDLGLAAEETAYRGLADALIVTGKTTGRSTCVDDVRTVKAAVPDRPALAGSGATPEDAAALWEVADGIIVGTSLKQGGITTNPLDPQRVAAFMRAIGR